MVARYLRWMLLLGCLLLPSCGGSGEAVAPGADAPADAPIVLAGSLFLGNQPVAGARVDLRSDGVVVQSVTTDLNGEFEFQNPVAGRADVVTELDGARLGAAVPPGESYVLINELSSLVFHYLELHPGSSLDEANRAVATALGLPLDEDLSRLSDGDLFDPKTFLEVAAGQGGLAAFLPAVAAQIGTRQFDFAAPDAFESLQAAGQDPHGQASPSPGILSFVGSSLARGAGSLAGEEALGWFLGLIGINTGPNLDAIASRLGDVETAIRRLGEDLKRQLTSAELKTALISLSEHSAILTTYAQFQRDANSERAPVIDEPVPVPAVIQAYLKETPQGKFSPVSAQLYANRFLDYMLVRTQATDIVLKYNQLESLRLGRTNPSSRLFFYDVRFNDLTRKLQNNLDFGVANVELAMDMLANASHSSFLEPQDLSGPYPENRLPGDIARARLFMLATSQQSVGGDNDCAALRRRALQLVPPLLPRDDVMVLPDVEVEGDTPTLAYRIAWRANTGNASAAAIFGAEWILHRSRIGAPWSFADNGWNLPTRAQMQAIEQLAREAGQGDLKQGFVNLGLFARTEDVPNFFHFRGAFFSDRRRLNVREVIHEVYVLGQGSTRQLSYTFGPQAHFTGALFVRGSLSGRTQAQADTILATGTTVIPTLAVTRPTPGRLRATATYRFDNGQEIAVDVTDRVEWLSSDPASVEVSNLDGDSGLLLSKKPATATLTAALLVDASAPQATGSYAIGELAVTTTGGSSLKGIEITPRNRIYTSLGSPVAYLYCSGFVGSDDPSIAGPTYAVRDLTSDPLLRWTLLDPAGKPVSLARARLSSAFGGGEPIGGILRLLNASLPTGTYTVRADYYNAPADATPQFSDQMKIRIQVQ